jgi:predicted acylesterase/phospholipase RssA
VSDGAPLQPRRSLDELELSLVRATTRASGLLAEHEEAALRTAISVARVTALGFGQAALPTDDLVAPLSRLLRERLEKILQPGRAPRRDELAPLVRPLGEAAVAAREALVERARDFLPAERVFHEIEQKALVLVSGGGGGTGYVYLGVMQLLDELNLRPRLLVGTSIGAILSLFRSRMVKFDQAEMVNIVRGLSFRRIFRVMSTESRYGVPAAFRLFLRAGIGRYFSQDPGAPATAPALQLHELPVPTLITVSGVRKGMLPKPLEAYERMIDATEPPGFDLTSVARGAQTAMTALADFFLRPERLVKIHLGADADTQGFDALDAAGFSSALPGVIHYDVLRDDARMRALLDGVCERYGITRFVDGGLVDNLPARAAWDAVDAGRLGTRNAFILGLNAFSPRLRTPLWLPLQRLAELNVAANRPYAHQVTDFQKTLSPLDVVPSVEALAQAIQWGKAQLAPDATFFARLLQPLPHLRLP